MKNPQLLIKLGATNTAVNSVSATIEGFIFEPRDQQRISSGKLTIPTQAGVSNLNSAACTLKLSTNWTNSSICHVQEKEMGS